MLKRLICVAALALMMAGVVICGSSEDIWDKENEEAPNCNSNKEQKEQELHNLWNILLMEKEDQQLVREVLAQEEISMLIGEVIEAKGENWESLKLEADVLEDRVSLQLSDETEGVTINFFWQQDSLEQELSMDGGKWDEFTVLWQQCDEILHEEGTSSYERFSWHMTDALHRERETLGKCILYQKAEGKQGFFRKNGTVFYQVESGNEITGVEKQEEGFFSDIQEVKAQIKMLSVMVEGESAGWEEAEEWERIRKQEESSEWKEPKCGLYAVMLWKLWDSRMPAWNVGWDSDAVRNAAYSQFLTEKGTPAWEEIEEVEKLLISLGDNDRIETFSDLKKFSGLKKIQVHGGDQERINFDLTKEMIPELEELSISYAEFENLSFLEKFPQMNHLYIMYCGLEDISGIECQKELQDISFFQNRIIDIEPLESCKKVEVLSLAFNKIKDISVLASLPELSEVGIHGNEISDISPLRNLIKLKKVNFNANQVVDLSPLRNLTNLTVLGASYNKISDISPLEGMAKLDNLALDYNEIQDIRVIENMTMLRYLGLYHNQIKDFSPAFGLTELLFCSVGENPGQNHIGDLLFLPSLEIGNGFSENERMQQEAQKILNQFYPEEELIAEDMAEGDLNGDGIADLAITGLGEPEEVEYDDGRKIYPFLKQADGSLRALESVDTLGPYSGGVYGDPYQGILITDGKLVAKVYGGSNWRWGFTDIYQCEEEKMKEKWMFEMEEYCLAPGYDFCITNVEDGSYRRYVIAGEWEGESRQLLIAQGGEELSPVEKEFDKKYAEYQEKEGVVLARLSGGIGRPSISTGSGYYGYQLHDQLCDTQRLPAEVLLEAAEKYLSEYEKLPVPYYTSEEILESYKTLTGVEWPEFFLIGQGVNGSGIKLIAYHDCRMQENGSYEHELSQWEISEDQFSFERHIYYDEKDGMLTVG